MAKIENLFPGYGMPPRHVPTKGELEEIARMAWFVRMAQFQGYVLATGSFPGKAKAMSYLLPDVFDDEKQAAKYTHLHSMETVAEHWGEDIQTVRLRLPGIKHRVRVLVRAKTPRGAKIILGRKLPEAEF